MLNGLYSTCWSFWSLNTTWTYTMWSFIGFFPFVCVNVSISKYSWKCIINNKQKTNLITEKYFWCCCDQNQNTYLNNGFAIYQVHFKNDFGILFIFANWLVHAETAANIIWRSQLMFMLHSAVTVSFPCCSACVVWQYQSWSPSKPDSYPLVCCVESRRQENTMWWLARVTQETVVFLAGIWSASASGWSTVACEKNGTGVERCK